MIIVTASGKGGTGKTTVATSLALAIQGEPLTFLDCDVEAPNAHLFLGPAFEQRQEVGLLIPEVDAARCTACGRCGEVCEYHAIVNIGEKVLVFSQLCHGCGSCTLNCPEGAIHEVPLTLGVLEGGLTPEGIQFSRGVLKIGEPMAVPVIRQLKKWRPFGEDQPGNGLTIYDAPPGLSCPVVETLRGADFALLVTEPTPFGLHDLKGAVQVVQELGIPAGVVINRDGIGDSQVEEYLQAAGVPVLMRIPMEREIAEALARGETLVGAFPAYTPRFLDLYRQILALSPARVEQRV
jgi:MinD superfamily P-loop ATPase